MVRSNMTIGGQGREESMKVMAGDGLDDTASLRATSTILKGASASVANDGERMMSVKTPT